MVEIRSAHATEAATIRRMVWQARLDPTQLRWQQFLVAEAAGRIVGVGQLRRYGSVQELGSLVIAPDQQGHGLGATLARALIERCDGPLYLECRSALSSFYEPLGFRQVSWREVPWPLRAKFALSSWVSRPFGGVATMMYKGTNAIGA